MRYLRFAALLGICLFCASFASAQRVVVGVGVGPAPACPYGYYGDYGYDAYAYDPGYAPGYVYARRYRGNYGGYRGCTGDENVDSAYPSWACQK